MKGQWQCRLKNPPEIINVGDKLIMLCEGDKPSGLSSPLYLDPLKGDPYFLLPFETLNVEEHFLAMRIVSYQTGEFNSPFIITDGKQELLIKDGISFSVQSVLPPGETHQPIGPIGPFRAPHPSNFSILFVAALAICILFSVPLCLALGVWGFFKRRGFIRKIVRRNHYLNPEKVFVLSLKQNKQLNQTVLDTLFKAFLENRFFIPAQSRKSKKILKALKKEHPSIYKKEGVFISRILSELSSGPAPLDKQSFLKLKKLTQEAVSHLSKKNL